MRICHLDASEDLVWSVAIRCAGTIQETESPGNVAADEDKMNDLSLLRRSFDSDRITEFAESLATSLDRQMKNAFRPE